MATLQQIVSRTLLTAASAALFAIPSKAEVTHSIYMIDQEGAPIASDTLEISLNTEPYMTAITDSTGLAVLSLATPDTSGISDPSHPSSFALSQNYPNPFTDQTKIDALGPGNVTVYNILGQKVAKTHELPLFGTYTLDLDMHSLASGTYLVSLDNGGEISTQKMMHLGNGQHGSQAKITAQYVGNVEQTSPVSKNSHTDEDRHNLEYLITAHRNQFNPEHSWAINIGENSTDSTYTLVHPVSSPVISDPSISFPEDSTRSFDLRNYVSLADTAFVTSTALTIDNSNPWHPVLIPAPDANGQMQYSIHAIGPGGETVEQFNANVTAMSDITFHVQSYALNDYIYPSFIKIGSDTLSSSNGIINTQLSSNQNLEMKIWFQNAAGEIRSYPLTEHISTPVNGADIGDKILRPIEFDLYDQNLNVVGDLTQPQDSSWFDVQGFARFIDYCVGTGAYNNYNGGSGGFFDHVLVRYAESENGIVPNNINIVRNYHWSDVNQTITMEQVTIDRFVNQFNSWYGPLLQESGLNMPIDIIDNWNHDMFQGPPHPGNFIPILPTGHQSFPGEIWVFGTLPHTYNFSMIGLQSGGEWGDPGEYSGRRAMNQETTTMFGFTNTPPENIGSMYRTIVSNATLLDTPSAADLAGLRIIFETTYVSGKPMFELFGDHLENN